MLGILKLSEFKFSSAQELDAARTFSPIQVRWIENVLVQSATEKINLAFSPDNLQAGALASEYLRGQVDILRYLLEISAAIGQTGPLGEQSGYIPTFEVAEEE